VANGGMDLRRLQASRTGVCAGAAPTYERGMVTAAARPHVFWVGEDKELVRGWPVGAALLETLGGINRDVHAALADERARLSERGYPDDLPLPALWWSPLPETAERPLLTAVGA
jgi:hypothetical protein